MADPWRWYDRLDDPVELRRIVHDLETRILRAKTLIEHREYGVALQYLMGGEAPGGFGPPLMADAIEPPEPGR